MCEVNCNSSDSERLPRPECPDVFIFNILISLSFTVFSGFTNNSMSSFAVMYSLLDAFILKLLQNF